CGETATAPEGRRSLGRVIRARPGRRLRLAGRTRAAYGHVPRRGRARSPPPAPGPARPPTARSCRVSVLARRVAPRRWRARVLVPPVLRLPTRRHDERRRAPSRQLRSSSPRAMRSALARDREPTEEKRPRLPTTAAPSHPCTSPDARARPAL